MKIEIPRQLSVDPDYPGFPGNIDDAMGLGRWLKITLDGVDQFGRVVAYDIAAGTITRFKYNDKGQAIVEGEEIALETVSGEVVVEIKAPE